MRAAYWLATSFSLLVLAGVVGVIVERVSDREMDAWRALRPR